MSYEISYKGDNSPRRAVIDLFQYVGLRRSKVILGEARRIAKIKNAVVRNKGYNGLCAQIELFCGVSGQPIRSLFEYVGGKDQLASWLNSDSEGKQK